METAAPSTSLWQSARRRSILPLATIFLAGAGLGQSSRDTYHFDFEGAAPPGYTEVIPGTPFTVERGYGFEESSSLISGQPFFFSARVPEGNYRVTVTLGDKEQASVTTVKAELRRLMIERIETKPGQMKTHSFLVNIRSPQLPSGAQVRLKEREKTLEAAAWDDKLTLEFSNNNPRLARLVIEPADVPTLYIAGDSTSTDQPREPFNSWGQMLTRFFGPDIAVSNQGESGEALRPFIAENRLAKLMSSMRRGDFLLIQFGHNDQKERGDGVGAFTTYKADLKRFVVETRQHGAIPILITSMQRRTFDTAGKITNSLGDYPEAVRQVAREDGVALIDLNAMSKVLYEALGPEGSGKLFAGNDHTHHSDYGSYELAKCVVQGIRASHSPLARYLVADLPPFHPDAPDPFSQFDIPPDPAAAAVKPYGN